MGATVSSSASAPGHNDLQNTTLNPRADPIGFFSQNFAFWCWYPEAVTATRQAVKMCIPMLCLAVDHRQGFEQTVAILQTTIEHGNPVAPVAVNQCRIGIVATYARLHNLRNTTVPLVPPNP